MPFFTTTSTPKPPTPAPVFAGLDDPFNFPTSKMRYTSRSTPRTRSPDSAKDSGYGSCDDDVPLSPRSRCRRGEKVRGREADNEHVWKPDLKHTFTFICREECGSGSASTSTSTPRPTPAPAPARKKNDNPPKKERKWYTTRVYARALEKREKSEGLTALQREMAPVLRRAGRGLDIDTDIDTETRTWLQEARPVERPSRPRKKSTLLHPSSPPPHPPSPSPSPSRQPPPHSTIRLVPTDPDSQPTPRGRLPSPRRHHRPQPQPSNPNPNPNSISTSTSTDSESETEEKLTLRHPRHRSKTPLRIPLSSASQPAPTPLRVLVRRGSVLRSCFSDSEDDEDKGEGGGGEGGDCDGEGEGDEVVFAVRAVVGRAVRVRVFGGEVVVC